MASVSLKGRQLFSVKDDKSNGFVQFFQTGGKVVFDCRIAGGDKMGAQGRKNGSARRVSKGTAVITGASSGLGAVFADRLASRGFDLILVARRKDRLIDLEKQLKSKYGASTKSIPADLTAEADLDSLIEILRHDSGITMLVNNAGAAAMKTIASISTGEINRLIDLNIRALTRLTSTVLPGFKERDLGTIVNIGSSLSFYTPPNTGVYSATKAYVMNYTFGLQQELAGTKVVAHLVMPAKTATEIWEVTGVPLSSLNQETVMSAEDCVDAALAGLDQGESGTLPSVEDYNLWAQFEEIRKRLYSASQTGRPASRYHVGFAESHSSK